MIKESAIENHRKLWGGETDGAKLKLDISRDDLKVCYSKSEVIDLHRRMWHFIADESLKSGFMVGKDDFRRVCKDLFHVHCKCFCCGWALAVARVLLSKIGLSVNPCTVCPLNWEVVNGTGNTGCGEIVTEWMKASDYESHAEVARRIANIPERNLSVDILKIKVGVEGEDFTLVDYIAESTNMWKWLADEVSNRGEVVKYNEYFNKNARVKGLIEVFPRELIKRIYETDEGRYGLSCVSEYRLCSSLGLGGCNEYENMGAAEAQNISANMYHKYKNYNYGFVSVLNELLSSRLTG